MIWLVPFLWIIILKAIAKPTSQQYNKKNKMNLTNLSEGGPIDTGWTVAFYSFFHGSGHGQNDCHSGHDSGSYESHGIHDYGSDSAYCGSDTTH
jgi:hypothetical protein